jgi:ubiquinone/menaquinone biosynthesis C-methylase UbiE
VTEQPGWQLSGNGPGAYERYTVPAFNVDEWARDLVRIAGVRTGCRVLDVGCGTGVVARAAARLVGPGGKVVGLDINEGMLQMAEQLAEREEVGSIAWRQGDAATMPFGEAEYDVVLCQQGLQYFPDRPAALREMARVMTPTGRLAFSVWRSLERHPFFVALVNVLTVCLGVNSTAPFRAAFSLFERDELKQLAGDAGFRNVHVRLDLKISRSASLAEFVPGYLSATPLACEVAAMAEEERTMMVRAVIQALRDYRDDDGLAAPMECHVVTAEK